MKQDVFTQPGSSAGLTQSTASSHIRYPNNVAVSAAQGIK